MFWLTVSHNTSWCFSNPLTLKSSCVTVHTHIGLGDFWDAKLTNPAGSGYTIATGVKRFTCRLKRFVLPVWSSQHSYVWEAPSSIWLQEEQKCVMTFFTTGKFMNSPRPEAPTSLESDCNKPNQAEDLANHSWQCNCNLWTFSVHQEAHKGSSLIMYMHSFTVWTYKTVRG